jgi:preprotein translocase subunit YajC
MRLQSSPIIACAGLALAAISVPAAAAVTAGATVKDTAGGEVGTIVRVEGDQLILKTDKHEVRLPVASFTATDSGALFAMTRDQLNAEVDKALAAANAQIVAGATVKGADGAALGTIEAVDSQFVTLKLASGTSVRLPRAAVTGGADGPVTSLTAEQLEAAAKGASS